WSYFYSLMQQRHLISSHFPYTTLFRSNRISRIYWRIHFGSPKCANRISSSFWTDTVWNSYKPSTNASHAASTKSCPKQTNALIADRKSTRLNSSHVKNSYAVFCLKKKK